MNSSGTNFPVITTSGNDFVDIIVFLAQHFYYFYPGFITVMWYGFLKSRDFKESKESIVKCMIISFVYVHFLLRFIDWSLFALINSIFKTNLKTGDCKDWVLVVASVLLPYLWWRIQDSKRCRLVLNKLRIPTSIYDNPFDYAFSKEPHVWVAAYMDDKGIMYEGYLRHYVSDLEKMQYIMISDYERHDIATEAEGDVKEEPASKAQADSAKAKGNGNANVESNNANNNAKGKKQKKKFFRKIRDFFVNIKMKSAKESSANGSQDWVILDRSQISRIEILFADKH